MNINEFVAKKLGELLAFNRVGTETLEKGRVALVEALGEEAIMDQEEKNRIHGEEIVRIATEAGVIDTTLASATKTEEKLRAMRDLYVSGQWNNAVEILEWNGFFQGAVMVHWAVIRGAGEALDNENLITLANEGVNYHCDLLDQSESELSQEGGDKASM